jgi:hypothetical protein
VYPGAPKSKYSAKGTILASSELSMLLKDIEKIKRIQSIVRMKALRRKFLQRSKRSTEYLNKNNL